MNGFNEFLPTGSQQAHVCNKENVNEQRWLDGCGQYLEVFDDRHLARRLARPLIFRRRPGRLSDLYGAGRNGKCGATNPSHETEAANEGACNSLPLRTKAPLCFPPASTPAASASDLPNNQPASVAEDAAGQLESGR